MGMGGGGAGGLDIQMHRLPLIGSFFGNPQEQYKQEQFQRAAESFGAYRPEAAQARLNALSNQSTAYQSANNLLGRMSGGQGGYKSDQLGKNPMGPGMMSVGQPKSLTQAPGQQGPGGAQDPLSMLLGGLPGGMPPNPFNGSPMNPFTGQNMPGMPGSPGGPPMPPGMPGGFNPFTGQGMPQGPSPFTGTQGGL